MMQKIKRRREVYKANESVITDCATPRSQERKCLISDRPKTKCSLQSPLQRYFCNKNNESKAKYVQCPICQERVSLKKINKHIDNLCQDEKGISVSSEIDSREGSEGHVGKMDADVNNLDSSNLLESNLDHDLSNWRLNLNPFRSDHGKNDVIIIDDDEAEQSIQLSKEASNTMKSILCSKADLSGIDAKHTNNNSNLPEIPINKDTSINTDSEKPKLDGFAEDNFSTECIPSHSDAENMALHDKISNYENSDNQTNESQEFDPYYLTNFRSVVDTVLLDDDFQNLFNADDLDIITKFKNMSNESQQLYVRLFLRKHKWLKNEKLSYPKISQSLAPFISELIKREFLLGMEHLDDLSEILNLLSAPEVREVAHFCQRFKDKHGKKLSAKEDYISAIEHHVNKQVSILSFGNKSHAVTNTLKAAVLKKSKSYLGNCVKLSEKPRELFNSLFNLHSMMNYSYNNEDNPNQAIIYRILQINRGEIVYPNYTIQRHASIFKNRQELFQYSTAVQLEQEFSSLMESKKFDKALDIYSIAIQEVDMILSSINNSKNNNRHCLFLPSYLRRFSSEWIYFRICGKSVEALEKKGLYEEAVQLLEILLKQKIFCKSARGTYWERIVIDTERYLKNSEKALEYLQNALADKHVRTGKRLSFYQKAAKICNATKNKHLKKRFEEFQIEELDDIQETTISAPIFLDTSSSQRTIFLSHENDGGNAIVKSLSDVEKYVLLHYKKAGYPEGVHGEGSPYTTIFFLLFWDIVFMDVADVFIGPFQPCPLDLFTDFFYENRKTSIDERLTELASYTKQQLRNFIYDSWMRNEGRISVGVNWKLFSSVDQLMDLVCCMGGRLITGICELFCKDFKNRASGMPDLLVWNPAQDTCKAIEVKGPGDRLSYRQIIWLNVLRSLGMDAEVCYVNGIGGKRKRVSEV